MNNLERLRQLTNELEHKVQIARIIETVPDVEMYHEVTNMLKDITGSAFGAFGYIDKDSSCVCPALTVFTVVEDCKVKPDDIIYTDDKSQMVHWCRIMKIGVKPFYNNDSSSFNIPTGHVTINNFLLCPIIFRKKFVGIFGLANKIGGYTDSNLEVILQLANYIAPVLSVRLERDYMASLIKGLRNNEK
jgi:hypothetical protein